MLTVKGPSLKLTPSKGESREIYRKLATSVSNSATAIT